MPSVSTMIARGMFCGAKYTHHTFSPIIIHLITTAANKHPGNTRLHVGRLSRQNVCRDKNDTCGNSRQRYSSGCGDSVVVAAKRAAVTRGCVVVVAGGGVEGQKEFRSFARNRTSLLLQLLLSSCFSVNTHTRTRTHARTHALTHTHT